MCNFRSKLYPRLPTYLPSTYLPTYLPPTYLPPTYLPSTYLPTFHLPTFLPPTYLPTFHLPTYLPPTYLPTYLPSTYLPTNASSDSFVLKMMMDGTKNILMSTCTLALNGHLSGWVESELVRFQLFQALERERERKKERKIEREWVRVIEMGIHLEQWPENSVWPVL